MLGFHGIDHCIWIFSLLPISLFSSNHYLFFNLPMCITLLFLPGYSFVFFIPPCAIVFQSYHLCWLSSLCARISVNDVVEGDWMRGDWMRK